MEKIQEHKFRNHVELKFNIRFVYVVITIVGREYNIHNDEHSFLFSIHKEDNNIKNNINNVDNNNSKEFSHNENQKINNQGVNKIIWNKEKDNDNV